MKKPFLMFAVQDQLNDLELRTCHPFARAVWWDLLCIMAGGQPYGHLAVTPPKRSQSPVATPGGIAPGVPPGTPPGTPQATPHGVPCGVSQTVYDIPENGSLEASIHVRLGYSREEFSWAIQHLEERRVFSRNTQGIIFSRRMVRDDQRHADKVKRAKSAYEKRIRAQAAAPAAGQPKPPGTTTKNATPSGIPPGTPPGTPPPPAAGTPVARPAGVPPAPPHNQNQNYKNQSPPAPPLPRGGARRETGKSKKTAEALAIVRKGLGK